MDEKLIELVRDHPVLYDTSDANYMRTKLKDELWEKIGTELETDGKAVKEQWRKLRENHREAMRRQKKRSGDGAKRQKPWVYQSQMEFLLPYMKNRSTLSNLEISSHSSSPTVDDDVDNTVGEGENQASADETGSEPVDHEIPQKKAKKRDDQSLLYQFMQSSEKRAKSRDEVRQRVLENQQLDNSNDALYQFFLSMYNTTKVLPARYQRQVRNKVYEAVVHAEEQHENEMFRYDSSSFSHGSTPTCATPPPTTTSSFVQHNLTEQYPEFFRPTSSQSADETSLLSM